MRELSRPTTIPRPARVAERELGPRSLPRGASPAPEDGVEDVAAILRVLAGESGAWDELVARHAGHLGRLLDGLLADHHLAEDVQQEAWLIAFANLPALRRRHRFRWWLRSIARREGLRARERWRRGLELACGSDAVPCGEPADGAADPALRACRREEIASSLAALRPVERSAMELVIRGSSYAEAGRALGYPAGSIATWVHRGRRRLVS